MAKSQITKQALSSAMKELMKEHPLEKIKIGDIVQLCNMNRQSFYYHFKDKYELVNWIFYTEFFVDIQNSMQKPGYELIDKICEFFYENRTFYKNALQFNGQNSFSEYFNEVTHPIIRARCEEFFENDRHKDFYATFFADAYRMAITRWLLEDTKIPLSEFVELIKKAATGFAHKIIMELDDKSD